MNKRLYAGIAVGIFFVAIVLLNHEPGSQRSSPLPEVKLLDAKKAARPESRSVSQQVAPQIEKLPGKYDYRGRSYDIDPDTYTHWIHGRRVLNDEVVPGSSEFDITKVKRGMIGYEPDRLTDADTVPWAGPPHSIAAVVPWSGCAVSD